MEVFFNSFKDLIALHNQGIVLSEIQRVLFTQLSGFYPLLFLNATTAFEKRLLHFS